MPRKMLILLLCGAMMHYFLGFMPRGIMPNDVNHLLSEQVKQITEGYQPPAVMPKSWLVIVAGSSYRTLFYLSENKPDKQAVERVFSKMGALPGEVTSGKSENRYVMRWHHQWSYLGRVYASTDLYPENLHLRFVRAMGLPTQTTEMPMLVCVDKCAALDPPLYIDSGNRDELITVQGPFVAGEALNISQWIAWWLWLVLAIFVLAFIWEMMASSKHDNRSDPKMPLMQHVMAFKQITSMVLVMMFAFLNHDGFQEMLGNGLVDLWAGGTRNISLGLVLILPILCYVLTAVSTRYRLKADLSKAVSRQHERLPLLQKTLAEIVYRRSMQIRHEDYILAKCDSLDLMGILPSVDHKRKIVFVPPLARLSMDVAQIDFWITRTLQDPHSGRNWDMGIGLSVLIAGGITQLMGYDNASLILQLVFWAIVFLWVGGNWGYEASKNTRADLAAIAVTGDPESAKRAIKRLYGYGKTGVKETPKRILAIDVKYPLAAKAVDHAVEVVS